MRDRHRCLMLGAGAMGSRWIRDVWQPFRSRMEFVGLVDPNPAALREASDWLGLPPAARFTDAGEAFATVDADFCCIVTPPAHHREAVELACGREMAILSEKPIAHTLEACGAIARAVKAAGVRMMVTQNYRYTRRILTLKQALTELGAVNYAVAGYASDYRERGVWGMFRHELRHGLLIEGGVHHLGQLRNLCGADCQTVAGWDWNPGHVRGETSAWRSSDAFDGETCALLVMRMMNGSFASGEGNNLETGKTNSWYGEYYRLECEGGAAVLGRDSVVRIEERSAAGTLQTREVPPLEVIWEGHQAVAVQFLDWLDGDPPPATTLADNLQSTAMLFAAIRASETGMTVNVQEMVRKLEGAE